MSANRYFMCLFWHRNKTIILKVWPSVEKYSVKYAVKYELNKTLFNAWGSSVVFASAVRHDMLSIVILWSVKCYYDESLYTGLAVSISADADWMFWCRLV